MKVRPRVIKRVATALTDPEPRFVSLVAHAATQQPFKSVKSDEPVYDTPEFWADWEAKHAFDEEAAKSGGREPVTDPVEGQDKKRKADSEPYGDVEYADPGYQADKKKRYPIDTAEHIRAAWNYIHKGKNGGKYSSGQLSRIKGKIRAAWKNKIDSAGPPDKKEASVSEEVSVRSFSFKKAIYPNATSVKQWLADGGYEGFVITDKGDTYEVAGPEATDDMFEELHIVQMGNGIVGNVGTLAVNTEAKIVPLEDVVEEGKAEDEKPIEDRIGATGDMPPWPPADQVRGPIPTARKRLPTLDPKLPEAKTVRRVTPSESSKARVAKAVTEITKKWDWWGAYSSCEFDLDGILAGGLIDGCPPGCCEVQDAMTTAMRNVLRTDDLTGVEKQQALSSIGSQWATVLYKMYDLFDSYKRETAENMAKGETAAVTSKAAQAWAAEMEGFVKSGVIKAMNTWGDQEAPVKPRSPESGEGDNPTDDAGTIENNKLSGANDGVELLDLPGKGTDDTVAGGQPGGGTGAAGNGKPAVTTERVSAKGGKMKPQTDGNSGDEDSNDDDDEDGQDGKSKAKGKKDDEFLTKSEFASLMGEAFKAAFAPVTKMVEEMSGRVDQLADDIKVTKADTEALAKRAPTKKSSSGGREENVTDTETAKKAAAEAEETRKFDQRMRANALGIGIAPQRRRA